METVNISTCCKAEAYEDDEHYTDENKYKCSKCKRRCEIAKVCAYCLGTGEVGAMEKVYPGEAPEANIGTRKCHCKLT